MLTSTSSATMPSSRVAVTPAMASCAHCTALARALAIFSAQPDFAPSQIKPDTSAIMFWIADKISLMPPPSKYTMPAEEPIEAAIAQPHRGESLPICDLI